MQNEESTYNPPRRILHFAMPRQMAWMLADAQPNPGLVINHLRHKECHAPGRGAKVIERTASLAEAAQVLGIDQTTLYRKRKRMGLE